MSLLHVGLLYGGVSAEHEVSVASARNVRAAFDATRYRVTPIRIDRQGRWHVESGAATALRPEDEAGRPEANPSPEAPSGSALLAPGRGGASVNVAAAQAASLAALGLDVAFPLLHGTNGEDGRIQGLLHALGLPYVGAGVLASAACMNKEVTKRLLRDAGLPVVPFRALHRGGAGCTYADAAAALGPALFVKPANSGSSVGTAKAEDADAFDRAVTDAFTYDHTVLVEQAVTGREVECAVIGNETPEVATPGEIVSSASFYTYDAKYEDDGAARMEVPADLPEAVAERLRAMAADAYRALGCEGMARVDFFLTPAGDLFVNEINTIPGFTARSMFPVMWAEAGRPLGALLDALVDLALARHERDARLKTSR